MNNDNITIDQFVNREIIFNQTCLIDDLINNDSGIVFSYDDVTNQYTHWVKANDKDTCDNCATEFIETDEEHICGSCYYEESKDIFEWWIVTDWMNKQLLKHNEPILDNDYGTWWGRTTTGQSISQDGVIKDIYEELIK